MKYKFKVTDKQLVYDGYHKLETYVFSFEKFDGGMCQDVHRELFVRKPCVGLLPYDPIRVEIILIEQIRLGPIANSEANPWMLEIVAGIIEENEEPSATVARESKEEANCEVSELIPIYDYYVTPGCSSETIKLYCGITDTSNSGGIHGVDAEHEDIKAHVYPFDKVMKMLDSGKIVNAATIVALQWLALNHDRLKNKK